jgi:LCP family protein required for cell wall assembly
VVAAVLSFIWPGLGQAYAARPRVAALLAIPAVVVAAWLLLQLVDGLELFALHLLDPDFAAVILVLTALVGVWRAGAIVHAFRLGPTKRRSAGAARSALATLLVLVVAMHGLVGYYAWSFVSAGSQIFVPEPADPPRTGTTPTRPPSVTPAPGATSTPAPSARPATNRTTFLLMGIDSGHDRNHALTDSLLVVSVDAVDKTAAMLSLPRDISRFPMYSGGTYAGKINSLLSSARRNPDRFPDGPIETLTRQVGFLIGVPIDHYASLNLEGFERMIDLVGGVDVDNERQIDDPLYDWFDGTYGYRLAPGPHHLDGRHALAYVRSRQGVGDSDFTRARRQQEVLASLRSQLTTPAALQRLPELLRVAGETIKTDFPVEGVRDFAALAREIGSERITGEVLGPPYARAEMRGTYVLLLDFERVATLSIELFGTDSNYSAGNTGAVP